MVGRESRRRPGSHRVAVSVSGSGVAALEEPSTRSEEESHGSDPGAREGSRWEWESQSCSVVILSSERALEEPSTATEGGIDMGLVGRPGTAAVAGGNDRSCTLIRLFRQSGLGGAAVDPGGENPGDNECVRGASVVEETEG
jgi:hypothetical protein